jgi:hypothetical protein
MPLPVADAAPVLPPLGSISMVPQMAFVSAALAADTSVLAPPVLPPTASTVSAPAPASMESVAPAVPLMAILPMVPQMALPLASPVPHQWKMQMKLYLKPLLQLLTQSPLCMFLVVRQEAWQQSK